MSLDLKGRKIRLATNNLPPYVSLNFDEELKEWKGVGGLDLKVVEVLSECFNFSLEIIECGFKWGQKFPNNTWNGIVGKVLYDEADLGAGTVVLTYERYEAISILYPHVTETVTFSSPIPRVYANSVSLFAPFDVIIWTCLLLTLLILLLAVHNMKEYEEISAGKFSWALISILNKQQYNQKWRITDKIRIIILTWLFSTLVLTVSYSGCLYSLMTIPSVSKPIETIYELAQSIENNEINAVAVGVTAHYQEIKRANSGVVGIIGQHLEPIRNPGIAAQMMKNHDEKTAYIETRSMLDFGLRRHNITNYFIPSLTKDSALYLLNAGIVIQKQFAYEKQFNKILSSIRESGLLHIWRKQFYFQIFKMEFFKYDYYNIEYYDHNSLSLVHLKNIFIMFIIGILASILFEVLQMIKIKILVNSSSRRLSKF